MHTFCCSRLSGLVGVLWSRLLALCPAKAGWHESTESTFSVFCSQDTPATSAGHGRASGCSTEHGRETWRQLSSAPSPRCTSSSCSRRRGSSRSVPSHTGFVPPLVLHTAPTAHVRQVSTRTPSFSPPAHAAVCLLTLPSLRAHASLCLHSPHAHAFCTPAPHSGAASSGWSCRSRGTEPSTMCLENSAEIQRHGAAPGCRRPCLPGRLDSCRSRVGQGGVPISTHAAARLSGDQRRAVMCGSRSQPQAARAMQSGQMRACAR